MRERRWEYIYISESKQNGHTVYEIGLIHHVDCVNYLAEKQAVAGGCLLDCVQPEMKISGRCSNESTNGCKVFPSLCSKFFNKVWRTECIRTTRFKCTGSLTLCYHSLCFNCLKERFWF